MNRSTCAVEESISGGDYSISAEYNNIPCETKLKGDETLPKDFRDVESK